MIRTLRRKFIIITMCSIILVLGSIVAIINITNYYKIDKSADILLNILADNNGVFPRSGAGHDNKMNDKKPLEHNLSPEAPFDTRYFTVTLRDINTLISVDTGRIAAVSTETAAEYALELYSSGKTSGYHGRYKYRAIACQEGYMYIFLDCSKDMSTFYSFLLASVLVSISGILLVFILVVFFSKIAVKPVSESVEKQKQFITDASHEIKTPLAVIDASAEVLEMEKGESEWINSIRNQIKRLSSLTDKLVFLSRMDEDRPVLNMTDFSLSDAVYETAKPFEAIAAAQNKHFNMHIEENISFYGDETFIRQLISLLLDNAMKYSNDNGFIYLELKHNGKSKEIIVKNSLEKIQIGRQDVLFERFYRPDASRSSETGGHGIGLSVVKAIVTAHKGKITAKSDDGKAIIFNLNF